LDCLNRFSDYELNVDAKLKRKLQKLLSNPDPLMFDPIQRSIWDLMVLDSVPKFLQSDQYEDYKAGKKLDPKTTVNNKSNRGNTLSVFENVHTLQYLQDRPKPPQEAVYDQLDE